MNGSVLHAVVGHQLPTYFLNAARSVRHLAPEDDLLIVDNDSNLPRLITELEALAAADDHTFLLARGSNDLTNAKVGGLYSAYAEILEFALDRGYELLHIVQADMQMLWWGDAAVSRAREIFDAFPECVNITTSAVPRGLTLGDDLILRPDGLVELSQYGLTDTGLYHLERWRRGQMYFHSSEQEHARAYAQTGNRVFCHPWPPVSQLPWPAVVRSGRVHGTEVALRQPFLLRPLDAAEIEEMCEHDGPIWLEDVCIPWGWLSLIPAWTTGLESIDPWVLLWRTLRARGWAGRPRWDRRGLAPTEASPVQHRPSRWQLVALPAFHEFRRRWRSFRAQPKR